MAFDGITLAGLAAQLREELIGSRISKIAQPEKDELILTFKTPQGQRRLLLCANASLPLVYLCSANKNSPATAPAFCMLLRKHLQNGRLVDITQPGLERILHFHIEHLDELGDLCRKELIIEIMGKHSNILFCQSDGTIIDAIKRISAMVSSLRQVLPGRPYFIPPTQDKRDMLSLDKEDLKEILAPPRPLFKSLYTQLTGLSPAMAAQICHRAGLSSDRQANLLTTEEMDRLFQAIESLKSAMALGTYAPSIAYQGKAPVEFGLWGMEMYEEQGCSLQAMADISPMLEQYYAEKSALGRIRQKASDLRHLIQQLLERARKKLQLQSLQLEDTAKRENWKLYGELLLTYGHMAQPGAPEAHLPNHYNGQTVRIPLDPALSAKDNAKAYYEKYNKLKRTYDNLQVQLAASAQEVEHLESVAESLNLATEEGDLAQIREELSSLGYLKRPSQAKGSPRGAKNTARPLRYVSSDGFTIYVGKNNWQNEELTFKLANGGDWWFHAKGIPGSHVLLRTGGAEQIPDRAFEEAGALAAYYSAARGADKVEVDYLQKKLLKKPAAGRPGMVIYHSNYSLVARRDISHLEQV